MDTSQLKHVFDRAIAQSRLHTCISWLHFKLVAFVGSDNARSAFQYFWETIPTSRLLTSEIAMHARLRMA